MRTISEQMILEQHFKRAEILVENTCKTLHSEQAVVVRGIFNTLKPLFEAELSADQIKKIFTDVQTSVSATGQNRTAMGKVKDTATAGVDLYNNTMANLGKWLQDTRPVQYFDQKFEKLQDTISTKYPQLAGYTKQIGEWAKANPGKTAAVIGILTAVASLAGPGTGAIAGQILKGSVELLKGEKLSTAVGRGAKSAAFGAAAGYATRALGDLLSSTVKMGTSKLPGYADWQWSNNSTATGFNTTKAVGKIEDIRAIDSLWKQATTASKNGDIETALTYFARAKEYAAKLLDPQYVAQMNQDKETAQQITAQAQNLYKVMDYASKAAQGAVTAATGNKSSATPAATSAPTTPPATSTPAPVKESKTIKFSISKARKIVRECADTTQILIAEGVMDSLKTIGTNITTKITADKLEKAWITSLKPTNSDDLSRFLIGQGIPQTIINSVYQANGIEQPGTQPSTTQQAQTTSGGQNMNLNQIQQQITQASLQDLESLLAAINQIESEQQTATSATTPQSAPVTQPAATRPVSNQRNKKFAKKQKRGRRL